MLNLAGWSPGLKLRRDRPVLARTDPGVRHRDTTPNLDEAAQWVNITALTCHFIVELPGIETDALPDLLLSDPPVRYVSFPLTPARYLRLR